LMNIRCSHCDALRWFDERVSSSSVGGPKEFRTNNVQYNASLAFTSLGVKVGQSVLDQGPPISRIYGELRHLSGSLPPDESLSPSYSQLYIFHDKTLLLTYIINNDLLYFIASGISGECDSASLSFTLTPQSNTISITNQLFEIELDNIAYIGRQSG
jgi:hypothetical protein